MPTAESRCRSCGHPFVHLTFKGDGTPAVCPRCGSRDIDIEAGRDGFMANGSLGALIAGVPKGPS